MTEATMHRLRSALKQTPDVLPPGVPMPTPGTLLKFVQELATHEVSMQLYPMYPFLKINHG